MPIDPQQLAGLDDLIVRYLEGKADADQVAHLQSLLQESPEARKRFVALSLHDRCLAELATASRPMRSASVDRTPARRMPDSMLALSGIAAAIVLTAAVVAIYVFVINPQSEIVNPQSSGPPIATLIESTDLLVYDDNIANEGGEYAAGDYSIESGAAQLLLTSRVTVDLQGATQLRMHNPMHASFRSGSATFECPPGAEGFTVDLPGEARVIDLGTRFRITNTDGVTRVKVLEGRVNIVRAGDEPVLLASGESAAVPVALDEPIDRSRIVADIAADWVDAATLPEHWSYYDSDQPHGGELQPLEPDQAIGNGGNRGFGGGKYSGFNLGAVLGQRNDGEEFEVFVDGHEGNAGEPGKDLLVHASEDYLILRYTVAGNIGDANIAGSFRELIGSSGNSITGSIYHNDTLVFSANGNDPEGSDGDPTNLGEADGAFDLNLSLAAGDTIDFVVYCNDDVPADETAIRATITVDEPAEPPAAPEPNFEETTPSVPPVTAEPVE